MKISPNIQKLKPSATLAINERSAELVAAGKTVYRLGFGQSPFPVPEEVVRTLQTHAHRKDYLPVRGLPELRAAVAGFNQRTLGLACTAEQVLIGPGSKELIYDFLLAADATLLLPAPSWVSYEPQAVLARKAVHRIETGAENGWLLSAKALREACKAVVGEKVLIINYPGNPTGTSFSLEQLQALAEVAREHEVLVIADEIYGEVHHQGQHQSIATYYPEGTIVSSGLSKWCGAGGWRLGTFTFPKRHIPLLDLLATIASETFTSVSAPVQFAAVKAFEGSPTISEYVRHSQDILRCVADFVHQRLLEMQLEMPAADGGFYLFPNFENHRAALAANGVLTSTALCEHLLDQSGVALLPGVAFGRPSEELTARLSFVDFDGAAALSYRKAQPETELDEAFILEYCPRIAAAMDTLRAYLKAL
ncbi:MAG: aminotransferase class I/II-fold pyridoxal phosphate-dependent enzyme [Bacteroidota bacterium]